MSKKKLRSKKNLSSSRANISDEDYWSEFEGRLKKKMEKECKIFGEDVKKSFESDGKVAEGKMAFVLGPFGVFGPVIKAIFGIICLIIIITVLNWFNASAANPFLFKIIFFFSTNMAWFFLISLLIEYGKLLLKVMGKKKHLLSPVVHGTEAIFSIWILANIFLAINAISNTWFISAICEFVLNNVSFIFVLFVLLGYFIVTLNMSKKIARF